MKQEELENLTERLKKETATKLYSIIIDPKYQSTGIEQPFSFAIEYFIQQINEKYKLYPVKFGVSLKESLEIDLVLSLEQPKDYSISNISIFIYQFFLTIKTFNMMFESFLFEYGKPFKVNLIQKEDKKFSAYDFVKPNAEVEGSFLDEYKQ